MPTMSKAIDVSCPYCGVVMSTMLDLEGTGRDEEPTRRQVLRCDIEMGENACEGLFAVEITRQVTYQVQRYSMAPVNLVEELEAPCPSP